MPYTHSLLGSVLWAAAAYALFRWIVVRDSSVALVVALAVSSHWVLDLIVHTPDLPIWSGESLKLGFGLWNNAIATFALEAMLLGSALWLYLRSTSANNAVGRYGMSVFVGLLVLVNVPNIFGPLMGDSELGMAISALTSYFLFAAAAFWLDTKRS